MMWNYYGGWVWIVPLMMVCAVVMIALLMGALRLFVGWQSGPDPAVETLRRRLAAGEITQEEFEKTNRLLHTS